MSLDGGYDSKDNRKLIFNAGMIPNIPENKRNQSEDRVGRKRIYDSEIYDERFRTIERVFAWCVIRSNPATESGPSGHP